MHSSTQPHSLGELRQHIKFQYIPWSDCGHANIVTVADSDRQRPLRTCCAKPFQKLRSLQDTSKLQMAKSLKPPSFANCLEVALDHEPRNKNARWSLLSTGADSCSSCASSWRRCFQGSPTRMASSPSREPRSFVHLYAGGHGCRFRLP